MNEQEIKIQRLLLEAKDLRIKLLWEALIGLLIGENCWCEVCIDPFFPHSKPCRLARAAILAV